MTNRTRALQARRSCFSRRSAALVAVVAQVALLSACSPAISYIVVRKADGYYVSDEHCPLRTITQVRVVEWDPDNRTEVGNDWVAVPVQSSGDALPPAGLKIGEASGTWRQVSTTEFQVGSSGELLVEIARDGNARGGGSTYDLELDVGQYRSSSGATGDWGALVEASDCLEN